MFVALRFDCQARVRVVGSGLNVVHYAHTRLIDVGLVSEQTIIEDLVLGQAESVVVVEAVVGRGVDSATARYIRTVTRAYQAEVLQRARIQPPEVDAQSGSVALGGFVYLAQRVVTRVGQTAEEAGRFVVWRGGTLLVLQYLVLVVLGLDAQEREKDQTEQAKYVQREESECFVAVLLVQVIKVVAGVRAG